MRTCLFLALLLIATPAVAQNPVTIAGPDPLPVTITVPPATWPLPTGAATEATLAAINGKLPALVGGRVPVDGSGVTQPVSGSVTVTQATGTNLHIVCDGGTCGGASPFADNSAFTFGTSGISNIGFVVDDVATNTVAENSSGAPRMSGNRIAYVDLSKTTANATAVKVDNSGVTQPVSGTITANLGTIAGVATEATLANVSTSANQTNGTQQAIVRGGAKGATAAATVTSTAQGADHQAFDVQNYFAGTAIDTRSIRALTFAGDKVDVSGSTGVGVTGTFFQATQPVSAAALPLPAGASTSANQATEIASLASIDTKLTNPLPISGTVTANAGTNLNTSALALDATLTGGTQQTKITNGTNIAAVTAASVAAASTDPTLVVGLNPLSNGVTPPYKTASGTLNVLNAAVTLTGSAPSLSLGSGNIGFSVQANTLIATLVAELSFDSTATWVATKFYDPTLQSFSTTRSKTSGNEQVGVIVSYSGATNARIRVSVYTSGTAGAFLQSLPDNHNPVVVVQGASLIQNLVGGAAPWQMSISDAAGGPLAAVKAGSTSAVAADAALVIRTVQLPTALATGGGLKADLTTIAGTATVTGGVAGILAVGGNVANAVAATANPVPVGGVFTTTPATLTTGQTATAQYTAAQNLKTDLSTVAGTATVTGGAAGSQGIGGISANDTAITQNPVLTAAETIAQGSQPTAATAGRQRQLLASTEGVQFVQEGNSNRFSCFVPLTATVTTQCQAAPAAGLRAYITSVVLTNGVITAQSIDVVYGTGAACVTGTTALTHKFAWVGATESGNQNSTIAFTTPLVPAAANAICVRPTAATAFGATITGFIAP